MFFRENKFAKPAKRQGKTDEKFSADSKTYKVF
jgi:hypothetical protein